VLPSLTQVAESTDRKLAGVVEAQARGAIDPALDPGELLSVVVGMVHAAAFADLSGVRCGADATTIAGAVAEAVRRVVTPSAAVTGAAAMDTLRG
jgi:hypothetical protein